MKNSMIDKALQNAYNIHEKNGLINGVKCKIYN